MLNAQLDSMNTTFFLSGLKAAGICKDVAIQKKVECEDYIPTTSTLMDSTILSLL